jgi:hypothetical protein
LHPVNLSDNRHIRRVAALLYDVLPDAMPRGPGN